MAGLQPSQLPTPPKSPTNTRNPSSLGKTRGWVQTLILSCVAHVLAM